jgi:outer membrane protein assembly factor BamB
MKSIAPAALRARVASVIARTIRIMNQTPRQPDVAYRLAIAAGVFSAAVAGVLLYNHWQLKTHDPIESADMVELRRELLLQPQDESLKERIRALDLDLRQSFFDRRDLSYSGAWLLLVSVAVMVGTWRYAAMKAERPPEPIPPPRQREEDAARERWVAMCVGLTLIGMVIPLLALPTVALTTSPPPPQTPVGMWPSFRGADGGGVSIDSDQYDYPTHWDGETGANIRWKTPIELPGMNSPIVTGSHVFCTAADATRREVYCFDADTGSLRWSRAVSLPGSPRESPETMDDTGYAAPTAATDGQRVFALFANGDLAAFDFTGRPAWATSLGVPDSMYGYASSLAVHDSLVIVQFDQGYADDERSQLIAFDAATGRRVWRKPRPVNASWASPIVAGGQLITLADPFAIAYEPLTGNELWRAEMMSGDVAPSPTTGAGYVFVVNPYDRLMALSADGAIAWSYDQIAPDITSPLCDGRFVYLLDTYGTLACIDAADGTEQWQHNFEDGSFHASPTLIGDRLYLTATTGMTRIIKAGEPFEEVGQAALGETVNASIAPIGGRIYMRGETHLYCIEQAK